MKEMLNEILHLTSKGLQDAKQIFKTTKEMKGYIEEEEVENLIKSVGLRQKWMEQSYDTKEKINKKLNKLFKKFTIENLDQIDQKLYPKVKEILFYINKAQDIYKRAYELEKQNQRRAESLLGEYKGKIIDIQQGKHAYQTYGRQPTGQSLLLNKVK